MAQPAKHNQGWSKDEVALLKKLYAKKVVHHEIAKQLKRTINAVESKATELGLTRKK
jgi:hypothetical protein